MGGVIPIDYDTFILVVVLMFAAVGFFRGWLREGITTLLLLLLVGLLLEPDLAKPIIEYVNRILKLFQILLADRGRFDLQAMARTTVEDVFDPNNPYNFMLYALIFLIALSYVGTRLFISEAKLTPLSHLLGGILGALNGFIVIFLVKEYLLKMVKPAPAAQIQALGVPGAAPGLVVAVTDVSPGLFRGYEYWLAVFIGLAIIVLIINTVTRLSIGKR